MPLSPLDAGAACALSRFSGFGAARLRALYQKTGSFLAATLADRATLLQAGIPETQADAFLSWWQPSFIEKDAELLAAAGIRIIVPEDDSFPHLLKEIPDPPAFLHVRGALAADAACIAVVGTRRATPYGMEIAREFSGHFSRTGVTVVSGLALGIDGAVHEAVLRTKGTTWAFLGSGIHQKNLYPATHQPLAERIVAEGGALLSEFPPGIMGMKFLFPIRNRLIAGVSLGVVVIEATERSGSLITAAAATDYNREVFAVPGDIRRPTSAGPHALIQRGATLAHTPADILAALRLNKATPPKTTALSQEETALLAHLSREPIFLDDLVRALRVPSADIARELSLLEMTGRVRAIPGGGWVRT
ncbi:DNA-processing protein DprA [Patescibacteria group bacterium]|nr:DNA-processing protein DprA [Patescibacteria group bacterium]